MTLEAPRLDDRTYDRLLTDLKQLVPRYTPEWTDLNDSDPGVVLMQLQAWLVEQVLYRLNRVPDRNYIMFLRLLGIELRPAQPATAELTFTLARDDVVGVTVPKGTQVAAAGEDGPIVFETDEASFALGATLAEVLSLEAPGTTVHTTANQQAGQSFRPFGARARFGSALLLGLASTEPFTDKDFDLTFFVTRPTEEREVHCDLDVSTLPLPVDLEWQYWDGTVWDDMVVYKDDTRAFTRSGHVYLRGPGTSARLDKMAGRPQPALGGPDKLYWIRCLLTGGGYDTTPRLDRVLINTVPATQAVTVTDEVLGGSDASQNQEFTVANFPLVTRKQPEQVLRSDGTTATVISLRLEVDEGQGFEVWQEVESFDRSGEDEAHFVLDAAEGVVRFGDGERGRIPLFNPANPSGSIVAREYRYGGGSAGNMAVGTITELQTFVEYADAVSNHTPSIGGREPQTVDQVGVMAASLLKSRNRAVTAEDFEFLAVQTPGATVARAKAMPLRLPSIPDVPVPGTVTVIVVPEGNEGDVAPVPSEATLRAVCAHLNRHRLLTSEVYVVAPTYLEVEVRARIIAIDSADTAEVTRSVTDALSEYFHPLTGGRFGDGWEFGGTIYLSEVYRLILNADEGVARIEERGLEIRLDGELQDANEDIEIPKGALVFSSSHEVKVSYDRSSS